MKFFIFTVLPTYLFAAPCFDLYELRGESLESTNNAIRCYQGEARSNFADATNKIAYLLFFKAVVFKETPESNFKKSFDYAKTAITHFGPFLDTNITLSEEDRVSLAKSYYLYATSLSKYVDLKGKLEAIKNMNNIKNSLRAVLKLKKPETYYYGAYRTLAIFNLKVPAIAGGSLDKARKYFEVLVKKSTLSNGKLSFPVGHLFYAEYFKAIKEMDLACEQIKKVSNITDAEIDEYYSEIEIEVLVDRSDARKMLKDYGC